MHLPNSKSAASRKTQPQCTPSHTLLHARSISLSKSKGYSLGHKYADGNKHEMSNTGTGQLPSFSASPLTDSGAEPQTAEGVSLGPTPSTTSSNCDCDEQIHREPDAAAASDADAERAHWNSVCRAYRQYAAFAMHQFHLQFHSRLANLPDSQRAVLPGHLLKGTIAQQERAKQFQEAAIRNQFCLDCILRHTGQPHSQQYTTDAAAATEEQMSKVTSVLKSLARDWSAEGQEERDMCYRPLLDSVQRYIPRSKGAKLSVPGAGVGRLALELAAKGFSVQGNEFSLFMLLASDFILNGPAVQMKISPWLLETRNVKYLNDPLRSVEIPDVNPLAMATQNADHEQNDVAKNATEKVSDHNTELPPSEVCMESEFSMAAGDFVSIYSQPSEANCWDAVVASFFLDAGVNIVQTLQVIHHMLRPGGYLISFGPLHWHWSGPAILLSDTTVAAYENRYKHLDHRYLHSVDFSWDEVEQIMTNVGLEMVEVHHDLPAFYTADFHSMLRTEYRCTHFVARKVVQDSAMPGLS